jgi:hypothetical protein
MPRVIGIDAQACRPAAWACSAKHMPRPRLLPLVTPVPSASSTDLAPRPLLPLSPAASVGPGIPRHCACSCPSALAGAISTTGLDPHVPPRPRGARIPRPAPSADHQTYPLSGTLSLCSPPVWLTFRPAALPFLLSTLAAHRFPRPRPIVHAPAIQSPPSLQIAAAVAIVRWLPSLPRLLLPPSSEFCPPPPRWPPPFLSANARESFPIRAHSTSPSQRERIHRSIPAALPLPLLPVSTRPVLDSHPFPSSPYHRHIANSRTSGQKPGSQNAPSSHQLPTFVARGLTILFPSPHFRFQAPLFHIPLAGDAGLAAKKRHWSNFRRLRAFKTICPSESDVPMTTSARCTFCTF